VDLVADLVANASRLAFTWSFALATARLAASADRLAALVPAFLAALALVQDSDGVPEKHVAKKRAKKASK